MATHQSVGSGGRDSDNQANPKGAHPKYSFNIVFNVIQNAQGLVSGARIVESQWPSETVLDDDQLMNHLT